MKPIELKNYRPIDTRSSDLHRAAELANRNITRLADYRRTIGDRLREIRRGEVA